jgi:hypothetical protein
MGGRDNSWVSNLKFLAKEQKWQQLKFSGLLQGKFILEGCLHTHPLKIDVMIIIRGVI